MATPIASDTFITVSGGEVFVRCWHLEGSKPAPIVLVHDSLGSIAQWRDFPSALAVATNRSVIAYDRLGFGLSSARLHCFFLSLSWKRRVIFFLC